MRRLGTHVGLYCLLLAALVALLPPGSSFGGDDGAYGGQVFALRQGGWTLERALPVVPEANEGWLNTSITADGPRPYTANPTWALALTGAVRLVSGARAADETGASLDLGLRLLPLLGAVVGAATAWALARRWDPAAAPLAFWLVALGPLLVNATTLWAHSLSSGLGGLTLLAVTGALDRHRSVRVRLALAAGATMALAATAAVRTEAILWITALAITIVLLDRRLPVLAATGAGAGAGGGVWLANRLWGEALRADRLPIETSVEVLNGSPGWLASRLPAAWRLLATSVGGGVGPTLTLAALALAAVAVIRIRAHREDGTSVDPAVRVALVGAAALYGLRIVTDPGATISGIVGAWPLVFVLLAGGGVASHHRRQPGSARGEGPSWAPALLVPPLVLTVLVLATQYASSGGHQWGGRYLSLAYVPLAAGAALAGRQLLTRYRVPLVALLVVPGLAGAVATIRLHTNHDRVVAAVTYPTAGPAVDPIDDGRSPTVVVTELAPLPRIAWGALPVTFYRASADDIDGLLAALAANEVSPVTVHGLADVDLDGVAGFQVAATDPDADLRQLELAPGPTPSPEALASDP